MNASASFFDIPIGTDTCTSPFLTMRIDSLLVLLYVNCIVIIIILLLHRGLPEMAGHIHMTVRFEVDALFL